MAARTRLTWNTVHNKNYFVYFEFRDFNGVLFIFISFKFILVVSRHRLLCLNSTRLADSGCSDTMMVNDTAIAAPLKLMGRHCGSQDGRSLIQFPFISSVEFFFSGNANQIFQLCYMQKNQCGDLKFYPCCALASDARSEQQILISVC